MLMFVYVIYQNVASFWIPLAMGEFPFGKISEFERLYESLRTFEADLIHTFLAFVAIFT